MLPEIDILEDNGFKVNTDLPFVLNTGKEFYVGYNQSLAAVAALIDDDEDYLLTKEELREMAATAKTKGIKHITLYTNYGVEIISKYEGSEIVGFNLILKLVSDF